MLRSALAGALILGAPVETTTQVTPEEAHRDAKGPSKLCGISGRDAEELMRIVRQTSRFREQPINSSRFEAFATKDGMTQWVFTRPSEPAYPAVTCRQVFRDEEGGLSQTRALLCGASREACDRLFVEFRDLDAQMVQAVSGE